MCPPRIDVFSSGFRCVRGGDAGGRGDSVRPESDGEQAGSVHLPGVQQAQRRGQHRQGNRKSHRRR